VYNPKKHLYETARSICSCPLVHQREQCLFRLYDPMSNRSFYKILTESEIRENIKFVNKISKISIEERRVRLIGTSFGEIAPLFASRLETKSHKYTRIQTAVGVLKAAEESAVLPLMPRMIPLDLLKYADCILKVNIETIQSFYRIESTRGPLTVKDVHADDEIRELHHSKHWEIFSNLKLVNRQLERVKHELYVRETRANNSEAHYAFCIEEEARARRLLDRDLMSFEDIRTQVINTFDKYIDLKKQIVDAVAFSKFGVEKVTAEELNLKEDWSQSHDGLENGNAWRGLNNQRRLETVLSEMRKVKKKESSTFSYIPRFFNPFCAGVPGAIPAKPDLEASTSLVHR
jgi:hypothetical protein